MLMFAISAICLWWLHSVVTRIVRRGAPYLAEEFEHKHDDARTTVGLRAPAPEPSPAVGTSSAVS